MGIAVKLSQVGGLLSTIINTIVQFFVNLVSIFAGPIFVFAYTTLVQPIFLVIDGITALFRKFAGLDSYIYEGKEVNGDVVLTLINNPTVRNIFWSLVILGVVILFITTFVAIIRSHMGSYEEQAKNTKAKIWAKSLRSLVNFFLIPAVAVLGIFMGNALLRSLDEATGGGGDGGISGRVFVAAAYNSNRARTGGSIKSAYGLSNAFADDMIQNGTNTFDVITGSNADEIAESIDNAFIHNATIEKNAGVLNVHANLGKIFSADFEEFAHTFVITFFSGGLAFLPHSCFTIYDGWFVYYYYNLGTFNYLIAILAGLFCCYVLLVTSIGLVKRMFEVVILFCIAPPIAALGPITEEPMKKWKQRFLGVVLSSYVTIVALNLTLMLIGPITSVEWFYVPDSGHWLNDLTKAASTGGVGLSIMLVNIIGAPLLNSLTNLLIVCAALLFFKNFTKDLSLIIGADNAYEEGAGVAKDLAKKVGKAAAVATGVGGAGVAAMKAAKAAKAGMKLSGKAVEGMAKNKVKDGVKDGGLGSSPAGEGAGGEAANSGNQDALSAGQFNGFADKQAYEQMVKEEKDRINQEENPVKAYSELAKARLKNAAWNAADLATGGLSTEAMSGYGIDVLKESRSKLENTKKTYGKSFGMYKANKGRINKTIKAKNLGDRAEQLGIKADKQAYKGKVNAYNRTMEKISSLKTKDDKKYLKGLNKLEKSRDKFAEDTDTYKKKQQEIDQYIKDHKSNVDSLGSHKYNNLALSHSGEHQQEKLAKETEKNRHEMEKAQEDLDKLKTKIEDFEKVQKEHEDLDKKLEKLQKEFDKKYKK